MEKKSVWAARFLPLIAAIVAAALWASGCEEKGVGGDTPDEKPTLSLSVAPAGISASAAAGSYTFAVSSNTAWSVAVTSGATWCTVSPAAGNGNGVVTITVPENQATALRTATITFAAGTLTCTTTVTQAAAENKPDDSSLQVEPSSISAVAEGGNYYFAIVSKSIWTAAITAGATWCTVYPTAGPGDATGLIVAAKNAAPEIRAATITFTSGSLTRTVSVTQAALVPTLTTDKATIEAAYTTGYYTVAVTSNTTWTAAVNAGATWCTVSPTSGTDNRTVTVNVATNPMAAARAATVTFATGTLTRALPVTQAGANPTLTTDKNVIEAASTAGSYAVAVTSNAAWTASVNSAATAWCLLTHASATGNGTVTVNVTANPMVATRAATVTFAAGTLTRTVAVKQYSTPPYAASTQTWTVGNQMWSDAIHVPDCNKSSFTTSNTEPHCRSYTSGTNTWYYYNWAYVNSRAALLCPSPWRAPTAEDFCTLDKSLSGASSCPSRTMSAQQVNATYVLAWGGSYGGYYNSSGTLRNQDTYAYYWSSRALDSSYAYGLEYVSSYVFPQGTYFKPYGFQVRCVK
jgi:uncharacterized protein (TIGR02145 family)